MKKFLLLLITVSAFNFATAQEHMRFKGIEMNGSLTSFVSQLQSKGMKESYAEGNIAKLSGDFASYHDCTIVVTANNNDNVVIVDVKFPYQTTWSLLYDNYSNIKEMLIVKYGKCSNSVEKWDGMSQPSDDRNRMFGVQTDRCKYVSKWETDNGNIELTISHNNNLCYITLSYFDKQNQAQTIQNAIDDL